MMSRIILIFLAFFLIPGQTAWATEKPTIITCAFDKQPVMIMTIRGGMGASDNTLQIGQASPVPLEIGSGLLTATQDGRDFIFSLRAPASVTVIGAGSDDQTFSGACKSSLRP